MSTGAIETFFAAALRRRAASVLAVLALTAALAAFAARVRPDYSIELVFPTFDRSRVEYEHLRRSFPHDDAHALVLVEAPDLFTPAGLRRVGALEADLARIPGVISVQGLTTVRHAAADGDGIRLEPLFPRPDLPPDELARRRAIATSDPLFAWTLATPDGRATTIRATLSREQAGTDAARGAFLSAAREVVGRHERAAAAAGAAQALTLSGLPVIRSEFTELLERDLGRLFPITFLVLVAVLGLAFRRAADVGAAVLAIAASALWTVGLMGIAGVPLQVLTQMTPIVVMIVCVSDGVHVVHAAREARARGADRRRAVAEAAASSLVPCLLTELVIAAGFASLAANDMVMIQQFGLVTAAGALLAWLASFTVLPLALDLLPGGAPATPARHGALASLPDRAVARIEAIVVGRPRAVLAVAGVIAAAALALGLRVGREYRSYDDLRPGSPVDRELRRVEAVHGGTVPMAIQVEPRDPAARTPDAMLEPGALALLDRIGRHLETEHGDDVRNARSAAKVVAAAHRLLAGGGAGPLPATRALAAQELLAVDDPEALRDLLSADRSSAVVFAMMPDRGSSHATSVLERLRAFARAEEAATPYRIAITGIYGVADGIYRSLVGGLAASLALAILVSFAAFFAALRSWRLAVVALVPNLLPLLVTLAIMSVLRIDVKPSTVVVFSVTLVIADDDTIQFLARVRRRVAELAPGDPAGAHRRAALDVLRETGAPMIVSALAIAAGFGVLSFSEFLGLANLGLLVGVSLASAVVADLFLTPIAVALAAPRRPGG